jgi:hypothetical protein
VAEAGTAGLQVEVVDLDTASLADAFPGVRFDTVVFADVLEHVKQPERALTDARSILNDDGRVIVSIPNVAHGNVRLDLLLGRFDYTSLGLLDHTHLRFFTETTLAALLAESGYEVEEIRRVRSPVESRRIADAVAALGLPAAAPDLLKLLSSDAAETFQYVVAARPTTVEGHRTSYRTLGDRTVDDGLPVAYLSIEAVPNVVADMRQVIDGLESSLHETQALLDSTIIAKDDLIAGLRASLSETEAYLAAVIHDKDHVIGGLEASIDETRAYFRQVVLDRDQENSRLHAELEEAQAMAEAGTRRLGWWW